ncbi:Acyl-CoA synthetase family member 2, mitochondrial [Eumeta japonica]|uniref:Medium-chain acyl-CoA ligase ACSF2, mitochondrial n=1 Tax=Eumeta variegata TaxID=151549 RepID=A0A4C1SRQ3_EUMVA|nr:Acyl-CoA synthetase family member 2, mitochondrial [Eumeta japonica]
MKSFEAKVLREYSGINHFKNSRYITENPSTLQFTSGTTGKPKAALISHFSMVNQAVYMGKALGIDAGNKSLCLTVPMFHAFGEIIILLFTLWLHLVPTKSTFNAVSTLNCIERENAMLSALPCLSICWILNLDYINPLIAWRLHLSVKTSLQS